MSYDKIVIFYCNFKIEQLNAVFMSVSGGTGLQIVVCDRDQVDKKCLMNKKVTEPILAPPSTLCMLLMSVSQKRLKFHISIKDDVEFIPIAAIRLISLRNSIVHLLIFDYKTEYSEDQ